MGSKGLGFGVWYSRFTEDFDRDFGSYFEDEGLCMRASDEVRDPYMGVSEGP